MLCSMDVREVPYNCPTHAQTINAKCKTTYDDSAIASPSLSWSTFEGASECSIASDEDDIDDVNPEKSQWQSISSRLAGVLRRQLQDDAVVDVTESVEDCHAIGKRLVAPLGRGIAGDSDETIASNAFSQVSHVSLQDVSPWESVRKRIAGVFQRQLRDQDDLGERTGDVERRRAAETRMTTVVRGFQFDEPNEIAQDVPETGDVESGDYTETTDTQSWSDVGARLSKVLRGLADTEPQNDSDDDSVHECALLGQTVSRRLGSVFGRQSTYDHFADEKRVSPERWQTVGRRMAAVFREAVADDGAMYMTDSGCKWTSSSPL